MHGGECPSPSRSSPPQARLGRPNRSDVSGMPPLQLPRPDWPPLCEPRKRSGSLASTTAPSSPLSCSRPSSFSLSMLWAQDQDWSLADRDDETEAGASLMPLGSFDVPPSRNCSKESSVSMPPSFSQDEGTMMPHMAAHLGQSARSAYPCVQPPTSPSWGRNEVDGETIRCSPTFRASSLLVSALNGNSQVPQN